MKTYNVETWEVRRVELQVKANSAAEAREIGKRPMVWPSGLVRVEVKNVRLNREVL